VELETSITPSTDLANSAFCDLYRLPSGINYALKLLLASGTRECLSLVLGSVFGGRSAPR